MNPWKRLKNELTFPSPSEETFDYLDFRDEFSLERIGVGGFVWVRQRLLTVVGAARILKLVLIPFSSDNSLRSVIAKANS
jgi:hypothetical protein